MGEPANEMKQRRVMFNLDTEDARVLDDVAAAEKLSIADVFRRSLRAHARSLGLLPPIGAANTNETDDPAS